MAEIRGYTLRQVRDFVAAIGRARQHERLLRLYDMRAAQAADKKAFAEYVKENFR